jgi:hypothetical protein
VLLEGRQSARPLSAAGAARWCDACDGSCLCHRARHRKHLEKSWPGAISAAVVSAWLGPSVLRGLLCPARRKQVCRCVPLWHADMDTVLDPIGGARCVAAQDTVHMPGSKRHHVQVLAPFG